MANGTKSAPLQALLDDRIGFYQSIDARLKKDGALASMPEFEPTVRYLQKELVHPDIVAYCQENSFAEGMRQLALNGLLHVDLDFQVSPYTGGMHQHKPPTDGRFPNIPTQTAIDEALSFFDTFERATKRGHDYHYQLDRYRYHSQTLPHLQGWFQLPTQDGVSCRDLIAMRPVPVGVRMVASRTGFLDAYFNSPKNAAVHDDNHGRRLNSENLGYFERNGITSEAIAAKALAEEGKTLSESEVEQRLSAAKMEVYKEFDKTVQTVILPGMDIVPEMTEEEKDIRKAMSVLYFEYLHEYAKTPDRETLKQEFMFQPDGPSAFEVFLRKGETADELENRRLDNKNLESGAIFTRGEASNTVYYFMDKGRNFLTSAYNKVTHGFFDNNQEGFDEAPRLGHREPEVFIQAAQRIMKDFNISAEETGLTREKILALLTNGAVEGDKLGKNLESYPGHDPNNPLNNAPRMVPDHKQSDAHVQGFLLG